MPIGSRVSKWLEQLVDSSLGDKTRLKAANSLSRTSEFYFHENRITQADRIEVVGLICPFATDKLTPVRACVAQMLGLVREWNRNVQNSLSQLLHDSETEPLVCAVWAVGALGSIAAPLIDDVLPLAHHHSREVRWRVPWALSKVKIGDSKVAASLIELASDEDRLAPMYALDAMAECQVDPELVFSAVVKGLNDVDGAVQAGACRAVAALAYDWSPIQERLFELLRQNHLDAVIAICETWPALIQHPEVNAWLNKNRGFWWATNFLDHGVMRSDATTS